MSVGRTTLQVDGVASNTSVVYRRSDMVDEQEEEVGQSPCISRSLGLTGPPTTLLASSHYRTPTASLARGAVCTLGVVIDHTYYQVYADIRPRRAVRVM